MNALKLLSIVLMICFSVPFFASAMQQPFQPSFWDRHSTLKKACAVFLGALAVTGGAPSSSAVIVPEASKDVCPVSSGIFPSGAVCFPYQYNAAIVDPVRSMTIVPGYMFIPGAAMITEEAAVAKLVVPVVSKIEDIDTLSDPRVLDTFRTADEDTLVVFDIDGTLTDDPDGGRCLHHYFWKPEDATKEDVAFIAEAKARYEEYKKAKGVGVVDDLRESSGLLKGNDLLIEPGTTDRLIRALQKRGVRVIAETAMPAGVFGVIPSTRILRFEKLQKVGIDFSSAFPQEQIVFDRLNSELGDYPMFYKGILLTNGKNDKGPVLGEFLDRIGWRPSKVLFFDDRRTHVESVGLEMGKRRIPYQGYWYRAAEKLPLAKFDRGIGQVQLQYILEHDEFLTAEEAAAILKTGAAAKAE